MKFPVQTLDAASLGRLDRFVSSRIESRAERRRHARLLLTLTASGLGAAMLLPVVGLLGVAGPVVAAGAAISSLCLILAAVLAATGALDTIAAAAVAALSLVVALGAISAGGTTSALVPLLCVAPLECFLAGRKTLLRVSVATASLAFGFVIGAEQLGLAKAGHSPFALAGSLCFAAVYLAVHAFRLRDRIASRHQAAEASTAERRLVERMLGEAVLRFAPDGTLIHASEGAGLVFGEGLADGRHPFLMSSIHVADRVRYLSAFGDIRSGAASARCEVRLSDPSGLGFTTTALELTAIRDARRQLVSIMVVVVRPAPRANPVDVELRRELDEARSVAEAKNNFLATVSHELRTPLNAIIGFSDLLDQEFFGAFETPRQKEYVGLIRQSGQHLLSVVNDLLDVSKMEAGHYELTCETVQPAETFGASLAAVRGEADRKGLVLTLRDEFSPASLMVDRRAVYQILLNLLSNAVKFTDEGEVSLTARNVDGALELAVTDTGPGIDPAELPKLGTPFVQGSTGLARRHVGTGLGLSLVKGLSGLHGGSMTIRSEPGRGTTVLVTLPCQGPAEGEGGLDNKERVVALKHARTNDSLQTSFETRRTA